MEDLGSGRCEFDHPRRDMRVVAFTDFGKHQPTSKSMKQRNAKPLLQKADVSADYSVVAVQPGSRLSYTAKAAHGFKCRSAAQRGGKEWVSTCRSRGAQDQ